MIELRWLERKIEVKNDPFYVSVSPAGEVITTNFTSVKVLQYRDILGNDFATPWQDVPTVKEEA